jgi:hypothetical protein
VNTWPAGDIGVFRNKMSTLASQLTGNLGALHVYTENPLGDHHASNYMKYWAVSEHPNPDSNDGGRIPFAPDLQAAMQQHISGFESLLLNLVSEYAQNSFTLKNKTIQNKTKSH